MKIIKNSEWSDDIGLRKTVLNLDCVECCFSVREKIQGKDLSYNIRCYAGKWTKDNPGLCELEKHYEK